MKNNTITDFEACENGDIDHNEHKQEDKDADHKHGHTNQHHHQHHKTHSKHEHKEVPKLSHFETLKKLEKKKADELEAEYTCLKILFTILETEEFKDIDYKSISYLDDTDDNELVLLSEKYATSKIIKKSDFREHFNFSPGAFIYFLYVNGAKNERASINKSNPLGFYSTDKFNSLVPQVGQYYLDTLTGFWKKASPKDIERIMHERKAAMYMQFDHASTIETDRESAKMDA